LKNIHRTLSCSIIGLIALIFVLIGCSAQPQKNTDSQISDIATIGILAEQSPSFKVFSNQIYTYKIDAANAGSVVWSWGDGSMDSTGNLIKKIWRKPGTFLVKLVATVNGKVMTTSQSITVTGIPITSGIQTTCAITKTSEVQCWGDSNYGFEAYGDFVRGSNYITIKDLFNVVSISRADNYSCAVKSDKTVSCWGYILTDNPKAAPEANYRELRPPHAVANLTEVVTISTAPLHTCALKSNGTVVCWGDNKFGQLGDGTVRRSYAKAVAVIDLSDAAAISLSGFHGCALKMNGEVVCWGNNAFGQLGDGSLINRPSPVTVTGLSDAVAINVGATSSCALRTGGSVMCWGHNNRGQLGDGTTESKNRPTTVFGLVDAISVSVGLTHACALKNNAQTVCWGSNDQGQLGDDSRIQKNTAVPVIKMSDAIAVSAGRLHTCALRATGNASCWGYNKGGVLGGDVKDTTEYKSVPVPVNDYANFLK
jgi:alpha-tubulin suppressor-like RCC1 family protein